MARLPETPHDPTGPQPEGPGTMPLPGSPAEEPVTPILPEHQPATQRR